MRKGKTEKTERAENEEIKTEAQTERKPQVLREITEELSRILMKAYDREQYFACVTLEWRYSIWLDGKAESEYEVDGEGENIGEIGVITKRERKTHKIQKTYTIRKTNRNKDR